MSLDFMKRSIESVCSAELRGAGHIAFGIVSMVAEVRPIGNVLVRGEQLPRSDKEGEDVA